mgnify:FL=1
MLNSGLRLAEIIDIKFSHIDFITGTLKIGMAKINLPNIEKVNITLNHKSLTLLEKIRDKYPNDKWVFQSRKSNNQKNKQPHSLSRQLVINTIKQANQYLEQKLSFNCFRHAYATSYFYDTLCVKNSLEHESINATLKYIKK